MKKQHYQQQNLKKRNYQNKQTNKQKTYEKFQMEYPGKRIKIEQKQSESLRMYKTLRKKKIPKDSRV